MGINHINNAKYIKDISGRSAFRGLETTFIFLSWDTRLLLSYCSYYLLV